MKTTAVRTYWLILTCCISCTAARTAVTLANIQTNDIRRDAVVVAVERVLPSVVNIATEELVSVVDPFEEIFRQFWDPYHKRRPKKTRYSIGSGVIIDKKGYLLSNAHVVRRASKIWVTLSTGEKVYEAFVISIHEKSDIALLKLNVSGEEFTPITFAQEDDLLLGETVIAVGNPFGLGGSVARGILSSKSRYVPAEDGQSDYDWIQTDAPINPGNSGGPLVNLRGELIGLNTAILRDAQGIGFAIPVRRILDALSEMFQPEVLPSRLWFGARLRGWQSPFTVLEVEPNSPAAKARLRPQDRILKIDGVIPRNYVHLISLIGERKPGPITITLIRSNTTNDAVVQLVQLERVFNTKLITEKLGIDVQPMGTSTSTASQMDIAGLVVTEVESGSKAEGVLRPGMIIVSIDGVPATDLVTVGRILNKKRRGDRVQLEVVSQTRQGQFHFLRRWIVELPVK